MSVPPSVRVVQPGPHLGGFPWKLIFEYFSKICWENSSFIKIGQKWRVLYMKINIHVLSYLAQFVLDWEMFQTKFVEKIKTHILCLITFSENRAVYANMWENILEPEWPQMTIWRTRIACWIAKATDTHSAYVTLIAFPLQQWLHERASVSVTRTLPVLLFSNSLPPCCSWGSGGLQCLEFWHYCVIWCYAYRTVNLLALELDIQIVAHLLCIIWIFYEPKRLRYEIHDIL